MVLFYMLVVALVCGVIVVHNLFARRELGMSTAFTVVMFITFVVGPTQIDKLPYIFLRADTQLGAAAGALFMVSFLAGLALTWTWKPLPPQAPVHPQSPGARRMRDPLILVALAYTVLGMSGIMFTNYVGYGAIIPTGFDISRRHEVFEGMGWALESRNIQYLGALMLLYAGLVYRSTFFVGMAFVALLGQSVLNLWGGSRQNLLQPWLGMALLYAMLQWRARVPAWVYPVVLIVIVIVSPLLNFYAFIRNRKITDMEKEMTAFFSEEGRGEDGAFMEHTAINFRTVSVLATQMPRQDFPFLWGTSYITFFTTPVPRVILPDKQTGIGHYTTQKLFQAGPNPKSVYTMTIVGEAFINFGWFGMIFIPFLWGIFMGWTDHNLPRAAAGHPLAVLTYVLAYQYIPMPAALGDGIHYCSYFYARYAPLLFALMLTVPLGVSFVAPKGDPPDSNGHVSGSPPPVPGAVASLSGSGPRAGVAVRPGGPRSGARPRPAAL